MSKLHVVQQGQGPVIVLSHALGCDLQMWDGTAQALQDRFTVVRYDHRGHGRSPATEGGFGMDALADDAAGVIEALGRGPVHFVGLSMGGMTAQALAVRHPSLVRSITIANSASWYDDAARTGWQARIATVGAQGVAAIADGAMQRWFTPEFRAGEAARVAALRAGLEAMAAAPYAAACAAVAGIDFRDSNRRIACPTLIIAGSRDEATPPALSEAMQSQIPGARLASLPASHLSAVEMPRAFADLVSDFIGGQPA
jgi:3-oxoadipate enol-lactonase